LLLMGLSLHVSITFISGAQFKLSALQTRSGLSKVSITFISGAQFKQEPRLYPFCSRYVSITFISGAQFKHHLKTLVFMLNSLNHLHKRCSIQTLIQTEPSHRIKSQSPS